MARAIDSEVAYRFLTEQLVKETGAFSKGVNKGLNIARSAIRNPDAIPTLTPPNEWVRVEERLPEHLKDVLALYGNGKIDIDWVDSSGNFKFGSLFDGVTHWMLLPAPPDRRPPEGEEDT